MMVPFSSAVPPPVAPEASVAVVAGLSSLGAQAARPAARPAATPIVPVMRRKPRRLAWWFSAFVIGTRTSRRALQRALTSQQMTSDI